MVGLISSERLKQMNEDVLKDAVCEFQETKVKVRTVSDGRYQAGSWPHPRRVIKKAEVMPQGTNQRFLAPNLSGTPFEAYQFYMQRGQVENYSKN